VARACDLAGRRQKDAAGAILYAAERRPRSRSTRLQISAATGYINEYPTGRLLRDAKLLRDRAGTSEIRRMLIWPRIV